MKKIFLCICLFTGLTGFAQKDADLRTLSLTAEGMADLTPDIIQANITLTASIYDQNPVDIFNKFCNEALDELKIKSIAKQTSTNTNNNNNYNQPTCNFFTRTFSIPMNSLDEFEKMRSTCESYKRNNMKMECVLTFLGVKGETMMKNKIVAYENALKNAKAKADLAVKTLGGTLGPAVSIAENGNSNYNYNNNNGVNYKDQYYSQDKVVKIPYIYTINVKFELKS